MSRSITFSLTALFTGAVVVLLSGNAQAQWTEDFESYPAGLLTSAPWDEGSAAALGPNQIVTAGAGYLGSQGLVAVGDNFGSLGNAWRAAPASGVTELTARLYSDNALSSGNSRYYIGFWNSATADGGHHADDDYVAIYMTSNAGGNFFSFETSNFDGPGGAFIAPIPPDDRADLEGGLVNDTWYDVRLTLNVDDTATGEYRVSTVGDNGDWNEIEDGIDIVDTVGFSPNFVGFRGGFNARLDDITVNGVPEPASLFLTGIAGLAMLWMRRRSNRC
jgi:hypothetical protein